ncbi:LLM class flavin-dependent oxidoreductase [Jiangella mangrovi]|uniref:Alkanesulfonate monooxygenase SsuD/methylene tetrahydromethanopterin reductase-like flavin-dependent oxidoreductase (Luciferase family) n=1 Tax=Jiangella mangrovi TaxID=1524084 RepID=A0A7W9GL32_9ACTN|nr:alkanesulfonate monooxygenase SsuD/methylene tetrahydromethanopterin reductase-like flavin-dependent oxidoreductase (luciferase family) [Jiangella mangrovi]
MARPEAVDVVSFGYFLVPDASQPLLDVARSVESLGLEYVGIQDHPYQRRFVDTVALSGAILAATSSLRVFPDVACLPLRPPGVLAKTAASLDVLSGGRFELGLGAGAFWDAIEGYGGQRRTPGEALAALGEAVEVIRMLWSGDRGLRFEGAHYHLRGVHSGPLPAHDIGIWIGAYQPRALALTGRVADGWVPSMSAQVAARLPELNDRVDDGAVSAGRDPSAVRRVFNVGGTITDGSSEGYLNGPVPQWVDELSALVTEHRADVLVFGGPPSQLRTFAEEVVPAVRAATP